MPLNLTHEVAALDRLGVGRGELRRSNAARTRMRQSIGGDKASGEAFGMTPGKVVLRLTISASFNVKPAHGK
jgi:hypothetical protein